MTAEHWYQLATAFSGLFGLSVGLVFWYLFLRRF